MSRAFLEVDSVCDSLLNKMGRSHCQWIKPTSQREAPKADRPWVIVALSYASPHRQPPERATSCSEPQASAPMNGHQYTLQDIWPSKAKWISFEEMDIIWPKHVYNPEVSSMRKWVVEIAYVCDTTGRLPNDKLRRFPATAAS